MTASRAPRPHRRPGRRAKEARQEGADARRPPEREPSVYEDLVEKITDKVIEEYGDVLTELAKPKYADAHEMEVIREKLKGRNVKARRYLEDK